MSTSCTSSATATTTSFTTSDSLLTTFTESTSTAAPTVTTITSSGCAVGNSSDSACLLSTSTTFTSTISGDVTTIQVPVTETFPVTSSQILTLFGSSCTVISATTTHSQPPSSSGSGSGSVFLSLSTPAPSIFTSESQTILANGQTSSILETITSNFPASVVYVTASPSSTPGLQSNQDNSGGNSAGTNIPAVVGGVVGGFFGLLGIALILWFVGKRRRRWDDIFDKEDAIAPPRPTKRFSLDAEIEPKPYQYGLVGQTRSPSAGISPPSSPALAPAVGRQHALSPLLLPTAASTPGPSATTISSRPSTAGSMRPLRAATGSPPAGPTHSHTTSSGSSTSVQHVPALPSHWGHHSPSPSAGQEYFERAGSPTSVRDYEPQRRLQLANVGDDGLGESLPTASPLGPAMLDGKGRNVRLGSGGAGVLVHTDAGPVPEGFQP
ncbi:hypothetical protein DFH07DRAFT_952958 [Mycena maculata]|uniref:Uncharacterized protein n=1 Tax=Mycena maculata TaxID=230809 RepID=A0AAD7JW71_9AGAR|nr:hypothetical protein DFH07DRAFT_952958 [Mycena maculata]